MKNTESKYNELIGKLQNAIPVDGNPDLLTDEIMRSIRLQHKNRTSGWLVWVRPLLTAAAMFLLGLFFYQQAETTNNLQDVGVSGYVKLPPVQEPECNSESAAKLTENSKLLSGYICYMKSNQAENRNSREFFRKYLPKNQATIAQ
jgi:hypothetical protein